MRCGGGSRSWRIISHKGEDVLYRACVQSALTYGTETWAMKVGNLHSLELNRAYDGEVECL